MVSMFTPQRSESEANGDRIRSRFCDAGHDHTRLLL
jgi:hypothetical protein